ANWADAARCCRTLEKLYAEAKHPEVADHYAGLAEKYAKSAGIELSGPETVAEAAAAVAHAVGEGIPEAVDIPASRVESKTKEIDLSTEWETVEATTAPQPPRSALTQSEIAALIEEIRFYLQHSLWDEAETAINKCAAQVPGSPELAQLREQLAAGRNPVPKAAPV